MQSSDKNDNDNDNDELSSLSLSSSLSSDDFSLNFGQNDDDDFSIPMESANGDKLQSKTLKGHKRLQKTLAPTYTPFMSKVYEQELIKNMRPVGPDFGYVWMHPKMSVHLNLINNSPKKNFYTSLLDGLCQNAISKTFISGLIDKVADGRLSLLLFFDPTSSSPYSSSSSLPTPIGAFVYGKTKIPNQIYVEVLCTKKGFGQDLWFIFLKIITGLALLQEQAFTQRALQTSSSLTNDAARKETRKRVQDTFEATEQSPNLSILLNALPNAIPFWSRMGFRPCFNSYCDESDDQRKVINYILRQYNQHVDIASNEELKLTQIYVRYLDRKQIGNADTGYLLYLKFQTTTT